MDKSKKIKNAYLNVIKEDKFWNGSYSANGFGWGTEGIFGDGKLNETPEEKAKHDENVNKIKEFEKTSPRALYDWLKENGYTYMDYEEWVSLHCPNAEANQDNTTDVIKEGKYWNGSYSARSYGWGDSRLAGRYHDDDDEDENPQNARDAYEDYVNNGGVMDFEEWKEYYYNEDAAAQVNEGADAADTMDAILFSTVDDLITNKFSLAAVNELAELLKGAQSEELKDFASVVEYAAIHREEDEGEEEQSGKDNLIITLIAANNGEDAQNALIKDAKKFNVTANFNEGGDHFSTWDLVGTKENLVKFLDGTNHWPDWRDAPDEVFEYEADANILLSEK